MYLKIEDLNKITDHLLAIEEIWKNENLPNNYDITDQNLKAQREIYLSAYRWIKDAHKQGFRSDIRATSFYNNQVTGQDVDIIYDTKVGKRNIYDLDSVRSGGWQNTDDAINECQQYNNKFLTEITKCCEEEIKNINQKDVTKNDNKEFQNKINYILLRYFDQKSTLSNISDVTNARDNEEKKPFIPKKGSMLEYINKQS